MASNLLAMASTLLAMASTLLAMASTLRTCDGLHPDSKLVPGGSLGM